MATIRKRYEVLRGVLDERSRRLLVAAESLAQGRGGISAVSRATGVSRQVIARGRQELTERPCKCPVAFGVPVASWERWRRCSWWTWNCRKEKANGW